MTKEEMDAFLEAKLGPMIASAVAAAIKPKEDAEKEIPFSGRSIIAGRKFKLEAHQKGIAAARMVRALAACKGDPGRAINFAKKAWDDELGDEIQKAMAASDFGQLGVMILPEYSAEIIELLRSKTIVRAAGARTLPMNSGSLSIRKQVAGSSASYVGESQDIGVTGPEMGMIELTAKKLAAIVPITNDLLMYTSGPSADEFIRDDLVREIAIREDRAFLRDDGTQHTPKGIRYWASPANIQGSNGTTSADIEADFKDLINALETNDVAMTNPVWFMHPSRKNHLYNLRDPNGNLIYPEIRNPRPTLYGYPVFVSTSIPANLGGGGDESEVSFVDMATTIIAEVQTLVIDVDSSASYVENNVMKSTFSRDETAIRAITRHDFAVRHREAAAFKNDVAWGG